MSSRETGLESESDPELVRRIGAGEGRALAEAELCRRFAPRVRLYGLRHLRSEDRAADLVQAVLLAVLEAARANRIERPDELVRFVLGTCRNVALRARQKDAQLQPAEPEELDVLAFVPTFEHVDTGALVRCLGHLDHRSRTVVMLSFENESTAEEIAKIVQTTAGNVRILRHRALAQLRGCLDGARGAAA